MKLSMLVLALPVVACAREPVGAGRLPLPVASASVSAVTSATAALPAEAPASADAARPPAVIGRPGEQMFQEGTPDDRCERDEDCIFYEPPMIGCGTNQCGPKAGTRAGEQRAQAEMRSYLDKAKCSSPRPPDPDACGHVGSYRCHCAPGKAPALRCEAHVCRFASLTQP